MQLKVSIIKHSKRESTFHQSKFQALQSHQSHLALEESTSNAKKNKSIQYHLLQQTAAFFIYFLYPSAFSLFLSYSSLFYHCSWADFLKLLSNPLLSRSSFHGAFHTPPLLISRSHTGVCRCPKSVANEAIRTKYSLFKKLRLNSQ